MKPAEAGTSTGGAGDSIARAEGRISYTEATRETGLSYWQLRYGVTRGAIPADMGGPGRPAQLSRQAVLEYARAKVPACNAAPPFSPDAAPRPSALEVPVFDPTAPAFEPLPTRQSRALELLSEADRLYSRLRAEARVLPSPAVLEGLEHRLKELWTDWSLFEWYADSRRRQEGAEAVAADEAEIEQKAGELITRLAVLWAKASEGRL